MAITIAIILFLCAPPNIISFTVVWEPELSDSAINHDHDLINKPPTKSGHSYTDSEFSLKFFSLTGTRSQANRPITAVPALFFPFRPRAPVGLVKLDGSEQSIYIQRKVCSSKSRGPTVAWYETRARHRFWSTARAEENYGNRE
jgi:hypothetical protein